MDQMDLSEDVQSPLKHRRKLGGNKATISVHVMAVLENMAFISNAVSLVTYFYGHMNFSLTKSATTLTNYMGTAYLLSLFGGFISDTYISRFKTCLIFGLLEAAGFSILTIQARYPQLKPPPCKDMATQMDKCQMANGNQEAMLFIGLYLVALGTGGIKAALPSLGADQFDERDPKEAPKLASFFNWLVFSITLGALLGVTFLVWVSANPGWDWSFGVCTVAVIIGLLILMMGRAVYRNNVPKGSPFVRIAQVFVAAIKNRKVPAPESAAELYEIQRKDAGIGTDVLVRTDQFKWLDRAAILKSSALDNADASMSTIPGPWSLCTITQVEETKILLRMLPIILSTIFINTCLAQLQTFTIQQGTTMDRSLGSFEVPAASIPAIPLFFMFLLLPVYDRVFVPVARKFTGIPTGITQLQRIGVGLVLATIAMAIAGVVETHRKSIAREHNMVDSLEPLPMSLFWLGLHYCIFGMADMFTLVGLLDFFYAESSLGMKSLGTAISWCALAFGYYTSSVVVNVVNKVSGGWLASNNLNRDKLNYFYWLLAGLSALNFVVYLICASWYRYKKIEMKQIDISDGEVDLQGKV